MTDRFEGVTAFVTGAASGIGAAVTRRLTGEGAHVVAVDRDAPALTRLYAADASVSSLALDLLDGVPDDVFAGRDLAVLVNAAGILRRSAVEDHTLADWEDTLAVNLTAPHRLSQLFVQDRLRRGATGAIVNVCSIESFTTLPAHAAYTVSKSALLMMTRAFALELAPHGVRVNAIAPGVTATGMNATLRADPAGAERLLSAVPMGRFASADEQAAAVAFLASADASYVTGAVLPVDGGWLTA